MLDLYFAITTREITYKDGDFVITENPSTQNAGIFQMSRCADLLNPMNGIGIEDIINSNMTKVTYEMNRWRQQLKNDGATVYKWSATQSGNDVTIETNVSYE